jgi:hypothetical protein
MANKKSTNTDDDFEDVENDSLDEYEELDFKKISPKHSLNARRRHEQLKEEKRLERLLNSDFDYFEDDDINYIDDFKNLSDYDGLYE